MKLDERTLLITKSGFRINFDVGVMKEETPICILWLAVAGDFVWLLVVDVLISRETDYKASWNFDLFNQNL